MTYENNRPYIPAEIRRKIMTEAGHKCSVNHCHEHIVEIHHIDGNRENNDINNLIVLCDKHHKLAHRGNISRKDLFEYKRLLINQNNSDALAVFNDHDLGLLNKINEIFTYDKIQQIINEPFGSLVPRNVIEPIDYFIYTSGDPLFHFNDQNLEMIRVDAIDKARKFMSHFVQQSAGGGDGYYAYISLSEIMRINPKADLEYWEQYSIDTQNLANDFCNAILLLRTEMRKL